MKSFWRNFSLFLFDASSKRFFVGTIIGVGFSMAVILSSVGIMDGFQILLGEGLKKNLGDLYFYSQRGFFEAPQYKNALEGLGVHEYSSIIKTEGFLIAEAKAKGVLATGIEPVEFHRVTKLKVDLTPSGILIGKALASEFGLNIGEEVALVFAQGNKLIDGMPEVRRFQVQGVIDHGIYQKDLRVVYLYRETLQEILQLRDRVNSVLLNVPRQARADKTNGDVERFMAKLQDSLGSEFLVKPHWHEFASLLKAVQYEKFYILLILQLVVVISVFNITAFFIYLNEKKAKEIFLLRALGLKNSQLKNFWYELIGLMWLLASLVALFFTWIFDEALKYLPFLKVPGSVYNLERFTLALGPLSTLSVLLLGLLWMLVLSWFGIRNISRQSPLKGLRKEFS